LRESRRAQRFGEGFTRNKIVYFDPLGSLRSPILPQGEDN
jgi:hypothetical protein